MNAIQRRIVSTTGAVALASALTLASIAGVAAADEATPPGASSNQESAPVGEAIGTPVEKEEAGRQGGHSDRYRLEYPASLKRGELLEMTGTCGPMPNRGTENRHRITMTPKTSGNRDEFVIIPEYDQQTGDFTVSLPVPRDAVPDAYEVTLFCIDHDAIFPAHHGELRIELNEGEEFTAPKPSALALTAATAKGYPGQSVQVEGRCRPVQLRGLTAWAGLVGKDRRPGGHFEVDPVTGEFSGSFVIAPATPAGSYKTGVRCGIGATSGLVEFADFTVEPLPGFAQFMGRIAGKDRYATAKAIAALGQWGDTVVLASGEVAADALAATPLAAALRAPIVLSPAARLDDSARQALTDAKTRGATRVIVVGGASTLRPQVEEQVRGLGLQTERLSGTDRFSTAIQLAQRTKAVYESKGLTVGGVFFADGTAYADALAAGPAAAARRGVLLLTNGTSLPAAVRQAAASFGEVYDVAIGGAAAKATASLSADRIVGADRHDTAKRANIRFIGDPAGVIVANGNDFPDALAAGALAANVGGGLLLTDANRLPASTSEYVANKQLNWIRVAGGEKSVSSAVYEQVKRAARK